MTVTTQAPASHIGLEQIEAAREVIKGRVVRTPTIAAPKLSELTGAEVYIKCENLQFTNSFKDRGALVKLASLSESEARRGVIAMSAGNHAQAVAYHASRLGIPATIVMPEHTPFVKVANTEAFGAEIILSGRGLYEAQTRAVEIAEQRGLVIVHPYDDPLIIAGQGTIALEVLEDVPDLDMIVVPMGGGGLIAGNAIAAACAQAEPCRDRGLFGGVPVDACSPYRRSGGLLRANARRRHRGESTGQAHFADRESTRLPHRAGGRASHRTRHLRPAHLAEDRR